MQTRLVCLRKPPVGNYAGGLYSPDYLDNHRQSGRPPCPTKSHSPSKQKQIKRETKRERLFCHGGILDRSFVSEADLRPFNVYVRGYVPLGWISGGAVDASLIKVLRA